MPAYPMSLNQVLYSLLDGDAHAVPAAQAVRETCQGLSLCAFNGTSALFTAILTAIWFAFV
jgi:hypothetical protein